MLAREEHAKTKHIQESSSMIKGVKHWRRQLTKQPQYPHHNKFPSWHEQLLHNQPAVMHIIDGNQLHPLHPVLSLSGLPQFV